MNCRQMLSHTVREGESFYTIAQMHQIPVEVLIAQNPGLNPYNLQVGTELTICMDAASPYETPRQNFNWENVMGLSNEMRKVWEQHVYWTRMLLLSIAGGLGDQKAVTERLLRNPMDMARIFGGFYPPEVRDTIAGALTEHLRIGGALMAALKNRNAAEASQLNRQWYENANQIADTLAGINPQYSAQELQQMLYRHLDILKQQIAARLAGNYSADIQAFDEGEVQALQMADYLTSGLVRQFPQQF